MRLKILVLCILCCEFLGGCGQEEFTEEWMQKEIHAWWGSEKIESVYIEDYLEEDSVVTVLARLVVDSDTTVRMSYAFRRFKNAWRISEGPVDEAIKELCVQELGRRTPMQEAREAVLKANGRNLSTVLEMYYAMAGTFPSKVTEGDSALSDELKDHFVPGIKNPYIAGALPFIDAMGDTSEWFEEYIGKVVYFPWVEGDGTVRYYLLRPSTAMGFIQPTLGQWPH